MPTKPKTAPIEADTTALDKENAAAERAAKRESEILARVKAGLTRAQAEEVQAGQDREDGLV